jgi:hypothetical protein
MTKTSRSSGRLIEANQEEGEDSSMAGESSPEAPRFKKMKPRVGHQYQTRVPKSVPSAPYAPNRPAPDKLSAEYPDARLKDIDMKDGDIVCKCRPCISLSSRSFGPDGARESEERAYERS